MPVARSPTGFRRMLPASYDPHGYVYALFDGEAVKVGHCRGHPVGRLRCLSTGNPRPLRLLAYSAETGRYTERRVHCRLSRWRVRGEWFEAAAPVLAEVASWDWVDPDCVKAVSAKAVMKEGQRCLAFVRQPRRGRSRSARPARTHARPTGRPASATGGDDEQQAR